MLMYRATSRHDPPRGNWYSLRGVCRSVSQRENATLPFAPGRLAPFGGVFRAQHMRRDADRSCEFAPLCPACKLVFVLREIQKPAAAKPRVFAGFLRYFLPQIQTLRCHRQLARVAVLLTAPSPVSARLLAGDTPFFNEGDLHATAREIICREDAHYAATDHDDVGLPRKGRTRLDMHERRRHRRPQVIWAS